MTLLSSNDSVKRSAMVPETPTNKETGNKVRAASNADNVNVSSYLSSGGAEKT
jgi:hypothetical protein